MPRDHDAAPAPMRAGSNSSLMGHPKKSDWTPKRQVGVPNPVFSRHSDAYPLRPSPALGPPLRRLSPWRAYNDPSICQTIATARITRMVTCYRLARRFEPSRRFVRKARQRFSRTEINRTIRKNPKQSPTWNLWAFLSWRTSWSYASLSHLCRFLSLC